MKWWLILLSITLVMFFNATVKDNTWKKSSRTKFSQLEKAKKLPQKRLFDLNTQVLSDQLKHAPKRSFNKNKKNISDVVISLPNADGSVEDYKVFEDSVMHEQLAHKYPRIKSYLGVSVKNPRVRAYFSNTPLGFKAMKRNPDKSTEFIEPVSSDLQTYTVYQSTEMPADLSNFTEAKLSLTARTIEDTSTQRITSEEGSLRILRLAISTDGATSQLFGNTKEHVLSGITGLVIRLNAIFENDLGVRVILVPNNDELLFMDAATDPYSGELLNRRSELSNTLSAVVGFDNYDIGHLIPFTGGNAGDAGGKACTLTKGQGYSTSGASHYDDVVMLDVLSHEMGHQMGALHSHAGSPGGGYPGGMEPGLGATIMSYGHVSGAQDYDHRFDHRYYHAVNIMQITQNLNEYNCGVLVQTGNFVPSADAGLDYMIPKLTPFALQGYGGDANAEDVLTYSWEQMDAGGGELANPAPSNTLGPMFRSYAPTSTPIRYFPNMDTILAGKLINSEYSCGTKGCEVLSEVERELNFRFTVRDNRIGGAATNSDDMVVKVNSSAGPFAVNSANTLVGYQIGSVQTISWSVAGTNANGINCSSVDILLSTDGGKTFPITLAAATPNDGSENITIPNMPGDKNRIMIKGTNHIFFDVNNANFSIYLIADSIAPSAPTNLSVDEIGTEYATVTWNPSTDNIGIIGYDVFQNGSLKYSTSGTALRVISGFSYYIKARDAAGNYSSASNILYVTNSYSSAADGMPTAAVLSATNIGSKSVTLEWSGATDDVGITGYDIYKDDLFIKKIETEDYRYNSTTKFIVPDYLLLPATTYKFFVVAYDKKNSRSPRSNILTVTTLAADTVAPSTPVLSYSSLTASKIRLSWTAATDNAAVKEYDVHINGVWRLSINAAFVDLTDLKPATSYSFSVYAKDSSGNKSLVSNIVSVTTLVDTTPPTAPILSYSNLGSTTATLNWTGSTDETSSASELTYHISGSLNGSTGGAMYSWSLTGLIPGNTYSYYIRAKDKAGNYSPLSNMVTFTMPPASVSAPSAPVLTVSNITMNSLKLSWSASIDDTGIANYTVYQNGTAKATSVKTSVDVGMLLPATNYSFYVVAKDVSGNVTSSNTLQVTTLADSLAPAPPVLSFSKTTSSSVVLNWGGASDNVGLSGYEIYQNGSLVTSSTTITYTATGLLPSTTYNFYVAVKDTAGNKSPSNIVSVATMGAVGDTTPPTSPILSYSSVTNSTVKLSWTRASDNNGVSSYRIYRNGAYLNTVNLANYTVMGLSPATTYSFYVVALDAAGNTSPVNNTISVTTLAGTADAVNPMPPTSFSASSITTSSANLSWYGATDNFAVVGYDIYQNGVLKTSTTATTLAVSGLSHSTKYNFYVVAKDAVGNKSAPSASVLVTTLTNDAIAPTAPILSYSSVTASAVNLSWSGATDNVAVTGYDLYKNGVLMSSGSISSIGVSNLSPSTTYTFYVIAKDAGGNRSVASNVVTITTLASTDTVAPTAPILSYSSVTASSVNLSWSGSSDNVGVAGYDVYQNGVFKSSVAGTSLAISGLLASTSYSFFVKAKDAAGNVSSSSNVVNVTTLSAADVIAPSAPVLSSSGLTSSSVNLSWSGATDNVGVVGYDVYQNGVFKSSVAGTSLAVAGLSASTSYSFYVKAKDAAGNVSASSNVVNVTTLASASGITVNLSVPATAVRRSTVVFSATASSSAGINRVEFYVNGSLACTDTTASYSCSWTVPGAKGKTYNIEARAYDNAGSSASSVKSLFAN